jgi:hypothetical protein
MLKRTLACIVAGALSAGAAEGSSSLLGQKVVQSFECAYLAGYAGMEPAMNGEPERLFRYGSEALKVWWKEARALPGYREGFGPYFGFIADQSDDFFVGMYAAVASNAVKKILDEEVPIEPGVSAEHWMELQGLFASREFARRNCAIVGR